MAGRGLAGKDFLTGGHEQEGRTAKAELLEFVGNRFEHACEEIHVLIPPVV
jgi:hypothetical protein